MVDLDRCQCDVPMASSVREREARRVAASSNLYLTLTAPDVQSPPATDNILNGLHVEDRNMRQRRGLRSSFAAEGTLSIGS